MSLKKEFTNIIAYCWNWLDWWLICHHNNERGWFQQRHVVYRNLIKYQFLY